MVKDYTAIEYSKYCMLEVPNRKKKVWEVENWSKSLSKIKTIQARAPLLRVTMRVGAS
jgi:hypothetical protein